MWKVLGAIVAVSMVIAAFKLAIVIFVLAGLIFRTKETLALLAVGALLALWSYSLLAGAAVTGLLVALAVYAAAKRTDENVEV